MTDGSSCELNMAFYFFEDKARHTLYTKIVGEPHSRELVAYYRAMIQKGAVGPHRRELLDGREISHVAVDLEGQEALVRLAEENSPALRHMKSALVASDLAVYGIFTQYQLMVGAHQEGLRVYPSIDKALAYLGIPPKEAGIRLSQVTLFSQDGAQ